MAAQDAVVLDTLAVASDLADDGTRWSDDGGCPATVWVDEFSNNDTSTGSAKVGKGGQGNGDALRIEYEDLAGLSVGDTISVWVTSLHQIDDGIEIQAYIDSNSVTATGAINIASPSIGENVFTLDSAFIAELGDLSGNFAVRMQPRAQESGDFQVAEIDADLTAGGAPAAVFLPFYPKRPDVLLRM